MALPSLNFVSQEFKSILDIYNFCFLRLQLNPHFDQNLLRRVKGCSASAAVLQVMTQSSAYLVN